MTYPLVPYTFRTGETLDPERIRRNFEKMRSDLERSAEKRYGYTQIVIPLDDLESADSTALRSIVIQTTFAYEIVAREIVVFGTDGETFTLSSDAGGRWRDLTVEGNGTTTRAWNADAGGAVVAANTAVTYTLSGAGSWTAPRAHAVIHVRYDRHGGALPSFTVPRIDGSVLDTASIINNAITSYGSAVDSDAANTTQRRVEVYVAKRDVTSDWSAAEDHHRLPAGGDTIEAVHVGLVAEVSLDVEFEVFDEAGGTVAAFGGIGGVGLSATATDSSTGLASVMNNDLDDSADDYRVEFTYSGSGTCAKAYVVVEYST